jgi:sugar O-acyltransferase (sialic acid O-acetyltransferase NeuD family)
MKQIPVPQINANETSAKLARIRAAGPVEAGEIVAELESSKSLVDVHTDTKGFFQPVALVGQMVEVGSLLGVVSQEPLSQDELLKLCAPPTPSVTGANESLRWTKKAELLAQANGIDIASLVTESGTVKEADVQRALKLKASKTTDMPLRYAGSTNPDAKRLLILGSGMAAMQVLDAVSRIPTLVPCGILDDDPKKLGSSVFGVKVLGPLSLADELWSSAQFDVAVCLLTNNRELRRSLFSRLQDKKIPFANVIDPSVLIQSQVNFGQGNVILGQSFLGLCSEVGNNNFMSGGTHLEHHNKIGSHNTFGPGVFTSAAVHIGDNVKFGTGIFIEPHVEIGNECVVASGSILTKSVPPHSIVKMKSVTTVVSK